MTDTPTPPPAEASGVLTNEERQVIELELQCVTPARDLVAIILRLVDEVERLTTIIKRFVAELSKFDLSKAQTDNILERWDQTHPEIQHDVVVRFATIADKCRTERDAARAEAAGLRKWIEEAPHLRDCCHAFDLDESHCWCGRVKLLSSPSPGSELLAEMKMLRAEIVALLASKQPLWDENERLREALEKIGCGCELASRDIARAALAGGERGKP